MADWQHTIESIKHIYYCLLSCFPIYYFFSFFIVDVVHRFNDGEVLERSGRLGQPIAAAHPDKVPPGCVGFLVSRDLASVSCVSRSRRDSSGDVSCISRSSPEAHGDVFVCEQPQLRAPLLCTLSINRPWAMAIGKSPLGGVGWAEKTRSTKMLSGKEKSAST
jgi:hypothetical protein